MIDPTIELLTLSNGDVGLFVNGKPIYTLDAHEDAPETPVEVADALATVFNVEVRDYIADVPTDPEWMWTEMYALKRPAETDGVEVKVC